MEVLLNKSCIFILCTVLAEKQDIVFTCVCECVWLQNTSTAHRRIFNKLGGIIPFEGLFRWVTFGVDRSKIKVRSNQISQMTLCIVKKRKEAFFKVLLRPIVLLTWPKAYLILKMTLLWSTMTSIRSNNLHLIYNNQSFVIILYECLVTMKCYHYNIKRSLALLDFGIYSTLKVNDGIISVKT